MAGREFSTYWFFYQEQKRKIPGGWKRKSKKELGNVFNLNLVEEFSQLSATNNQMGLAELNREFSL